jgi:hypothetical protein
MIKVVNLRLENYSVYIGRTGHGQDGSLGNPVAIGKACPVCGQIHMDSGSTLPCYKKYLWKRVHTDKAFYEKLKELEKRHKDGENVIFGCFCHPKPCHGNIVKAYIEAGCPL